MADTLWDAITRRATDFLEGGQDRTAALQQLGRDLEYYVPPELRSRIGLLAKGLEFTDAGDMPAAAEASRELWDNPSVGSAANYAAAGLGLALPYVSSRVMQKGVDVTGDAISSLADDAKSIWARLSQPGPVPTMYSNPVGRAADDAPQGILAYHGSPHDFDKFSMNKIGTGEGAQAYGHGLYFAEAEPVARGYRDMLSDRDAPLGAFVKPSGDTVDVLDAPDGFYSLLGEQPDNTSYDRLLKAAQDKLEWAQTRKGGMRDELSRKAQKVLDFVKENEGVRFERNPARGRMYEVNIKANPEDFLDWDKYIKDQPEIAKKLGYRVRSDLEISNDAKALFDQYGAYDKMPPKVREKINALQDELNMPSGEITGERAYLGARDDVEYLVQQMSPGVSQARAASMREAGIPGIKYLDAMSRNAGEGSRNYVVFDENLISIIRKYGIAGAAAMLGISQADLAQAMQSQQQQQPQGLLGGPQ